ncbi:hypothetical protein DNTS_031084 [Danionella cerebrum]|uniref:Fibronectin type-III domain-containing protein n=1 Tax=Danionella cerebrum TaxID=2873325 RepID=A0A553MM80_9TELE|nr:hypothetical protein DNTS_031084 [Danionella translucida]
MDHVSGTNVVFFWFWLFLSAFTAAEEEVLMDTKRETSDLKWTIYPSADPEWEEVSGLDEEGNIVRTFQVCASHTSSSQWLRTGFMDLRGASVVYAQIRFSMMECTAQPHSLTPCRETFSVYSFQTDFLLSPGKERKWNLRTLRIGPLSRKGFYLAFVSQGACMALLSIKVYLKKCPSHIRSFSAFPETLPHSLVQLARGKCVDNSGPTHHSQAPPTMLCREDGQWAEPPSSECVCNAGFEPVEDQSCRACPLGQFKPAAGASVCGVCPDNSNTQSSGSRECVCRLGFYRAPADPPDSPCTEPLLAGGRADLSYSVQCSHCPASRCVPCSDTISYHPSQVGVTGRRVFIRGLLPHSTFTFTVQSENGVSAVSHTSPASSSINVTTSTDVWVTVSGLRRLRASESSISISWSSPPHSSHPVQEFQLRYSPKGQEESWQYVSSRSNSVTVNHLSRATQYQIQVRVRTSAGYGPFSTVEILGTLPDDEASPSRMVLTGVLVALGLLVLIAVVIVAVFCCRHSRCSRDPDPDKSSQFLMGPGMKVYIDPFTYEDPNEAVREFTKEIDVSFVKIEEVIGAGPLSPCSTPVPLHHCLCAPLWHLTHLSTEDLLRIGVTLAGHQKKILSSVQALQVHGGSLRF